MVDSTFWMAASTIAVGLLGAVVYFFLGRGKKHLHLAPLVAVLFGWVVMAIVLGDDWLLGLTLLTIGVVFAAVGLIRRLRTHGS